MKKCCLREIFARFSQSNVTPFREKQPFFQVRAFFRLPPPPSLGNKLRLTSFQTLFLLKTPTTAGNPSIQ